MKRITLLIVGVALYVALASAYSFKTEDLKREKDSSGRYGYVNNGEKQGWWHDAHLLGEDNEEMNHGFDKQFVISCQYDEAEEQFSENLSAVTFDGRLGFIDKYNRFIIQPVFEAYKKPGGFRHGLAPVKIDGKFGYIDKSGNMIISPQFDDAEPFDEDWLAVVKVNSKFGAIDILGDTIVPCAYPAKEIMKLVPLKNKQYRQARKDVEQRLKEGYYAQRIAMLDSASRVTELIIADSLKRIRPSLEMKLIANKDSTYMLIRAENDTIRKGDKRAYELGSGYFYYGEQIIDEYGRVIKSYPTGKVIHYPENHVFVVNKYTMSPEQSENPFYSPNCGLLSEAGGWIFPPLLTEIDEFVNNYATVRLGEAYGEISSDGFLDEDFFTSILDLSQRGDDHQRFYVDGLVAIAPGASLAHNNLGIAFATDNNNLKMAIKHLSIAHKLDPNNQNIVANLKAAKSERNNRRWNKVLTGLQIAGAVLSLGATVATIATGQSAEVMSDDSFSVSSGSSDMDFSVNQDNNIGSKSTEGSAYDPEAFYRKWESKAIRIYESLDGHSGSPSTYVHRKKLLRSAQKQMRKARREARKRGIDIPKSEYEDIDVGVD